MENWRNSSVLEERVSYNDEHFLRCRELLSKCAGWMERSMADHGYARYEYRVREILNAVYEELEVLSKRLGD